MLTLMFVFRVLSCPRPLPSDLGWLPPLISLLSPQDALHSHCLLRKQNSYFDHRRGLWLHATHSKTLVQLRQ
ncbi:hypothetical protein IE81DRAFT_323389 [Ceraceosorus guamensis]|uniref:Uncharacterized protein n=1 Tax=Ceraceosorus guamensis TaxID=1522189 RepID=A0A316W1I8_9BASI|nr:hypothetical protein IE81DRAFT_323389 [Ceraceosorus guamensis]PWN42431.1 hypothetical protein IE81DRAFT_323389 [Ceraceosorus guamensis]